MLSSVTAYSHFITDDTGRVIVGDGKPPLSNDLFLFDLIEKKESVLCSHGSTGAPRTDPVTGYTNTQIAHPHPCFSHDGRKVVFASDADGAPAVYVVEV